MKREDSKELDEDCKGLLREVIAAGEKEAEAKAAKERKDRAEQAAKELLQEEEAAAKKLQQAEVKAAKKRAKKAAWWDTCLKSELDDSSLWNLEAVLQ